MKARPNNPEARARELARAFADSADNYSAALLGYLSTQDLIRPPIKRVLVQDDGSILTMLMDGKEILYGTYDTLTQWIDWVAHSSGMGPDEKRQLARWADKKIEISPNYLRKIKFVLPSPKETATGIPLDPRTGEPVYSNQDYLADGDLDHLIDNQGPEVLMRIASDVIREYPYDWTFPKSSYQPGQWEIHKFVDYLGDERLDYIQILKTGPVKHGEPNPALRLLSGKPGNKNDSFIPHLIGDWQDTIGNWFVWFYDVPIFCDFWESEYFDDNYIENLRKLMPDPAMQNRAILEYDISYCNPSDYQPYEIGWLGIWVACRMLNDEMHLYRPEPEIVLLDPNQQHEDTKGFALTPELILNSVTRHNNLQASSVVTQYAEGLCFSPAFKV